MAMKRKRSDVIDTTIQADFIELCEQQFKADPGNIIKRNCVNAVGSVIASTNSNRVNEISHIFLNSVKKKNLKATNQGASGRCWMFSALNSFRHVLINALGLENFEFSEVYLFFWDKLERSNTYLLWFIEHPEEGPGDRPYEFMLQYYMSDGGYWNTFSNLASKYGLVPASAMKETYQSDDSEDMNQIIKDELDSTVNYFRKYRHKFSIDELHDIRRNTLNQIYNTLVKFLGEPPKKFDWLFNREGEDGTEPEIVCKSSPRDFFEMVTPRTDMNKDFIMLMHSPTENMKLYTNYRIRYTNNVAEGEPCTFFNVPIGELAKYAMISISKGFAVWFAADVRQCFNTFHSALDDKLDDHKTIFGETKKFEKGDRMTLRNVEACHAMALVGFNVDANGKPISWQVENSWGYYDHDTPGLDGFLYMSHSWFEKYVIELVVHKEFLSRSMKKKIEESEYIDVNPWDACAPAMVGGKGRGTAPAGYLKTLQRKRN
jgi:bleomycin hydrolase